MAYGFGSTYGAGTTDRIRVDNTVTVSGNTFTWLFRIFQHGTGGGGFGRVFDDGLVAFDLSPRSTPSRLDFRSVWSGADGEWTISQPSLDVWHTHAITYNSANAANNPAWVVDGSSQTVTRATSPSGSPGSGAVSIDIGNTSAGTRNWDGMIADLAWYNRILTADEIAAYMAGYSSRVISAGLLLRHDLLRDAHSQWNGTTTLTGTAVQPHPRIIMPTRHKVALHVAGGGGVGAALHHHRQLMGAA